MSVSKEILPTPPKKVSLASLMPDKTKGIAAKKRAVKRYVATASKKSPVKKPVTKLLTQKRVNQNSKLKQSTSKPAVRLVSTKKTHTKKASSRIEPTIQLPASISIRAKEKSLVLLQALSKDFYIPAQKVAIVSGFCFITFGSYLSLAFSGALPQSITPQAALLASSSPVIEPLDSLQAAQNATAQPIFSLLEALPAVIDQSSNSTFSVTESKKVVVELYSESTGEQTELAVDPLVEGTYRFTVDPSSLAEGRYIVKTVVTSAHDGSKRSFRVSEFTVTSTTESLPTTSTSTAQTIPPVDLNSEALTPDVSIAEEIDTLTIKTLGTEFFGRTVLKAFAPPDTRFVEFYARPIRSTHLRFLGLGEKRDDFWQYFFNSAQLPNGTYELLVKTRTNNTALESDSVIVAISNYVPVTAPAPEQAEEVSKDDSVSYDSENSRSFSEYTLFEAETQNSSSSTKNQSNEIDAVLEGYRDELQTLLERYGVAQQSGDPLLIEITKTELQNTKTRLVAEVLSNPSLSILGDDVDNALTIKFEELQKRIETFEELRRVASEESSSADTDIDGISDFDELNLYRTNSEEPDTDNDGVTDGVEIMRGYNPLDATAEAVIVFELPQETLGLVENDLLKVESVLPFIKTEDPTVAPIVQASIKGKGLPNSYVTIYVFSTPTIVTVRTDNEGSFEYTFEKELEDGEHEVYVAVTDNAGAIMARSNPFRFIKEAQAFTPIAAASSTAAPIEMSLYDLQAFDSYNIAVGLGILALGIILLTLGSGLREKKFADSITPANDVHAT